MIRLRRSLRGAQSSLHRFDRDFRFSNRGWRLDPDVKMESQERLKCDRLCFGTDEPPAESLLELSVKPGLFLV